MFYGSHRYFTTRNSILGLDGGGSYRNLPVCPICLVYISPILMKLLKDGVCDLRICKLEDNPCPKNMKGDNDLWVM